MKKTSLSTAIAAPLISTTLLLGLAGPLSGQVTVTDHGLTTPTDFVTGFTTAPTNRFGFRTGNYFQQTFTLTKLITLNSIFITYTTFDDFTGSITITVDAGNDGSNEISETITLDSANFIGNDGTSAGTPTYWMEWDLSSHNLVLPAGTSNFRLTLNSLTDPGANPYLFAPTYSTANRYAGGQVAWNINASTANTDINFAVTEVPPPDIDGDNLPDPWELSYPGVTTLADLDGTKAAGSGPGSGTGDFDGDGLSDLDEYTKNTNPTLADSDTDGINDGDEVGGLKNPYTGFFPGNLPGDPTDPLDADSDNDGILDGEEVTAGADTYVTNPNEADTDGDTLPDGWEVTYTLDPTDDGSTAVANGKSGDPDEDTLDNGAELAAGTNPREPDTDDDGYNDNAEDSFASWFNENATGTSPLKPDTDGDGLLDGHENPDTGTANASPYNCDPNKFDTDGDFYGDGDEITAGTDPGSELSVPTGIPMRNVGFTNSGGGWTATGGVALSTTSELLTGSGHYAVVDCNSSNRGVTVPHGNPSAMVYCSVDFRIEGAMATTAEAFNIMDGGTPQAMSQAGTHCILRIFGDASVQAYNGSSFESVVPPGGIVAGTTYTAQIDHDIPGKVWSARVVDRSTGSVVGSIAGVTVRPTSDPAATPLYFTVGSQSAQSAWDVAVDNMVVSLSAIDAGIIPSTEPLVVTHVGFNGDALELTVSGFDTAKQYVLKRSADLADGFPTPVGSAFTPATTTQIVSDPTPPAGKAFYRVEAVTP